MRKRHKKPEDADTIDEFWCGNCPHLSGGCTANGCVYTCDVFGELDIYDGPIATCEQIYWEPGDPLHDPNEEVPPVVED